jgi:hypothetical protein
MAWSAFASEHRGQVTFQGQPVPGATVIASQGERKLTTTTDEGGAYRFADLADGVWSVTVAMAGFMPTSQTLTVAAGGAAAAWDLKMALLPSPKARPSTPGGPATAAAAARARAAAANGGGGGGGGMGGGGGGGMGGGGMMGGAGGGGAGDSLIMSGSLGGASSSLTQPDNFGNRMKNGQAVYNGNASFTLDNSVWDAQSYSLNGRPTEKPAFAKGRANLSFGGPLRIPKLFNSKAGMFTVNYQLGRTRNGVTSTITAPSLLERTGDFSQSDVQGPVTVYDPLNGQPTPGNRIPASRQDPTALKLLAYYPQPNASGARLNYQTPIVSTSDQDNLNIRINQNLSKNDRLSGSIGYQRSSNRTPNVFGFVDRGRNNGVNANLSWSHTFNKRYIATAGFTFSRSRTELLPFFAERENVAANLGIQGTSGLPLNWGPPNLAFTNFATLSDGNASLSRNQTGSANASLLIRMKRHQLTLGGDYRRQQINPLSDANGRGVYTFTGLASSRNSDGGYDLADLLYGIPDTASIRFGNADKYFRSWHAGLFAQDNWQLNPKLSANLGLRYDFTSPYSELYGRMANLDVASDFSGIEVVRAGERGAYSGALPTSLLRPYFARVAPNLGLAWRPFTKRQKTPTILRVGYAINYEESIYGSMANSLAGQAPFARVLNVAHSADAPLSLQRGFTAAPTVANVFAVTPDLRPPRIQQFMAIAIQVLPRGVYLVGGYVRADGSQLPREFLPNSLPPGAAAAGGAPSGYAYMRGDGRLDANLAIVQVGRQMGSGLGGSLNYIFAGATDDCGLANGRDSLIIAQNWRDLEAERARTSVIPRHSVNANWQYSTGHGKAGGTLTKGLKGALLKDWTVTNSVFVRSGPLLTATVGGVGSTITGTAFTGTLRADATGQPVEAPTGSNQPFNLAAFAVPQSGAWGTSRRAAIAGPVQFGVNGSLGRVFRLNDQRSFDLRFDANNVINHMTLTGWGTVVNSLSYGLPVGSNPMRSMTATLRFRF